MFINDRRFSLCAGPVKKLRIVNDTESGKPSGYAFVEFESERDMKAAYKQADGQKINGRRVVVDVERGRCGLSAPDTLPARAAAAPQCNFRSGLKRPSLPPPPPLVYPNEFSTQHATPSSPIDDLTTELMPLTSRLILSVCLLVLVL